MELYSYFTFIYLPVCTDAHRLVEIILDPSKALEQSFSPIPVETHRVKRYGDLAVSLFPILLFLEIVDAYTLFMRALTI